MIIMYLYIYLLQYHMFSFLEDLVYMEDEQLLDEYILNDVGKIWVGAWGSARGREWIFGQFDAYVLKACQLLLERSGIKANSRGDPIQMCRAISRIVSLFVIESFFLCSVII